MKKSVLMTALAGLMLASCTFEEGRVQNQKEINFSTAPYAAQTKAEHDLNQTLKAPFKVWAWDQDNNNAVIDGKVATYVESSSSWNVADGPYYWGDLTLDFVAIIPAESNPYCSVTRAADGSLTTVSYAFTNANPNPRNVNLMHSDFVEGQKGGTVNLGFRHALANVTVTVQQKNPETLDANVNYYEVVLTEMKVTGIHRQGTYSVTSNDQNRNDHVWTYDPASPTSDISYIPAASNRSLNPGNSANNYVYPEVGNSLYVMPQNLSNDAKFVISYKIITHTTSGVNTGAVTTVEVQMNTITDGTNPITAWYTNKKINYTINILPNFTLDGIQFSVKEEEWGTQSGSTTI